MVNSENSSRPSYKKVCSSVNHFLFVYNHFKYVTKCRQWQTINHFEEVNFHDDFRTVLCSWFTDYCQQKIYIYARYFRIFKANASKLQGNLEKICSWYTPCILMSLTWYYSINIVLYNNTTYIVKIIPVHIELYKQFKDIYMSVCMHVRNNHRNCFTDLTVILMCHFALCCCYIYICI